MVAVYDIVRFGEVIYVGMTQDPKGRMTAHRRTGIASPLSNMRIVRWYTSRKAAAQAETKRIKRLNPKHNESGKGSGLFWRLMDDYRRCKEYEETLAAEEKSKRKTARRGQR